MFGLGRRSNEGPSDHKKGASVRWDPKESPGLTSAATRRSALGTTHPKSIFDPMSPNNPMPTALNPVAPGYRRHSVWSPTNPNNPLPTALNPVAPGFRRHHSLSSPMNPLNPLNPMSPNNPTRSAQNPAAPGYRRRHGR